MISARKSPTSLRSAYRVYGSFLVAVLMTKIAEDIHLFVGRKMKD